MNRLTTTVCLMSLLAACSSSGDGVASSAAALTSALNGASPGDTVHVGAGTFTGSFAVPAGVFVVGAGSTTIIDNGDGSAPALVVTATAGQPPTMIQNVDLTSAGGAAMVVGGTGDVEIQHVHATVNLGIGIGIQDVHTVQMLDVQVSGPVTTDVIPTLPLDATPDVTATHGIVIVGVAQATMNDVQASGFALFGALLVDSTTSWTGGGASDNVGVGVMAYGGSATLHSLELCRTLSAFRLQPPYGAVFANGAAVDTDSLNVCDGEGYGILESGGASGQNLNLSASGNHGSGVWLQSVDNVQIAGDATNIDNNYLAGVVAIDSSNIALADGTISNTQLMTRISAETGTVNVGDGVHLVRSTDGISLSNLTLQTNHRAGALFDLNGASTSGITLDSVTATTEDPSGETPELGVVAQDGTLMPGWDTGVTRAGTATTNDTSFISAGSTLGIVDVVAPTDMPQAANLETQGLNAVGVVAPTD